MHLEQVTNEGETVVEEIIKADEEQWAEEGDNEGEVEVEKKINAEEREVLIKEQVELIASKVHDFVLNSFTFVAP